MTGGDHQRGKSPGEIIMGKLPGGNYRWEITGGNHRGRYHLDTLIHMGPSIKYVTLFLANFTPLPLSHFVTYPWTPRKYVTHFGPPDF